MDRPSRPRTPWRIVRHALRWAAIAYLSVLLLMSFLERWLVYPAPPASAGEWAPTGDDYQDVWIDVPPYAPGKQTARLHGWYFEQPAAEEVILYCHGNGEDVSHQPQLARFLRDELNSSVLVWDYRGYGQSEGTPHELAVVADGIAAQNWLAEQTQRKPEQIVLIGRSLGGGVATAIAAEQGAAALILQDTFSRITDAAAKHYPWLPVQLVMRNRYDSLQRIRQYAGPVFVSHGRADEIVPYEQGVRLYDAAPSAYKQFVELAKPSHNAPMPVSYYEQLRQFLRERPSQVVASEAAASPQDAAG